MKLFILSENCIVCNYERFLPEDFEIVDVYRYKGNSDPADIESHSSLNGILVAGYEASSNTMSTSVLEKLKMK